MKRATNIPVAFTLLIWLISTTLFARGTPSQVVYQSIWLLSQEERPRVSKKFDEYPNLRFNDEKARLDNFVIELQNDHRAQGYIIGYGGRICYAGEAIARANRAKGYMINTRGIESGRIITVDGGYRRDVGAELFVRPLGASEPAASPTVGKCTKPAPKPTTTRPRNVDDCGKTSPCKDRRQQVEATNPV